MIPEPLRRLSSRLAFLDSALSWIERGWRWLPAWARRVLAASVVAALSLAAGVLTTVVVWIGRFSDDFGALAVLSILAAAGAATQLRGVAEGVGSAMDRLAASRQPVIRTRPLSAEERAQVQAIRAVWKRYGRQAVTTMRDAFDLIVTGMRDGGPYWAPLLDRELREIQAAVDQFEIVLDPTLNTPPEEVRREFNEMYDHYLTAVMWTAKVRGRGDAPSHEGYGDMLDRRLAAWAEAHRLFFDRLSDLATDPEHKPLRVFHDYIEDRDFAELLREAQKPLLRDVGPPPVRSDPDSKADPMNGSA